MKLRVLVLGAGFGGLELSTILSENLGDRLDLTLIDRNDSFYFGFSKFEIIFRNKPREVIQLPYRNISKPGIRFVQENIIHIDPDNKRVMTDRETYEADVLVIALGADYDLNATPGLMEAGHEFYSLEGSEKLRDALPAFNGGHVVVGVTSAPFKCPPAPSEAALLMHEYLSDRGIRQSSTISLIMPFGVPIPPSPDTSAVLLQAFKDFGIRYIANRRVDSLDPLRRVAILDNREEIPFDLFLGVPRHHVPDVVAKSGMTVDGWIPAHPFNFTTSYPGVYALGDVANVGTPKAGVFSEGAARVAAAAIIASFDAGEHPAPYTGEGSCYVNFGGGRVGRVDVAFFTGPKPVGKFKEPSDSIVGEKQRIASDREERWFGIKSISPIELNEMMQRSPEKICIIDLMEKEVYDTDHVDGAINIPVEQLEERLHEIPADKDVIVVCRRGLMRSDMALQKLQQAGIPYVQKLKGGTIGWIDYKTEISD